MMRLKFNPIGTLKRLSLVNVMPNLDLRPRTVIYVENVALFTFTKIGYSAFNKS